MIFKFYKFIIKYVTLEFFFLIVSLKSLLVPFVFYRRDQASFETQLDRVLITEILPAVWH